MKELLKDFKDFAVKGNLIEIAVGVIIGGAFNKIVNVLVHEVLMPPLTMLTDGVNWDDKRIVLKQAVLENGTIIQSEVAVGYGKFITSTVDFIIIAFTVFIVLKFFKHWKKKAEDVNNKEVETPQNIQLMSDMKTLLEKQNELLEQNLRK